MIIKRKRRGPVTLPTASMGDIAFLLTIFFMVCSNFAKESNVRYKPAESAEVVTVRDAGLSVVLDAEGQLYLNGRTMESPAALQTEMESSLKGKTNAALRDVMFKCDRNVTRKVFEPALGAIIGAGGVVVAVGNKPLGE